MAINFNCSCGETIEVDNELAGKQARCPYCEAVVNVPAAAPPRSSTAKRAKLAQPEETEDDHGAYAGSLNPLDKSNRRPSRRRDDEDDRPPRRRRDEDDEDADDRPSKRRRRDDDDFDDDDYRPRRSRRYRREEPEYKLLNKQTVGGAIAMIIGVVITALLLVFADRIGCWFVILIIGGLITMIRGLVTGRDQ
jgi:hypothetical protein